MNQAWSKTSLGEIFDIARGGSPRPIDDFITDDENGVNWVMISDASLSGKYINSTKKRIRLDGVKRSRMVYPGDFLLTNSMSFGRPYIMNTSGCIHDGWLVLSPRSENISPDFLYHLLGSQFVYSEFERRASGATVKNLNIDLVKNVEIPLPPLPEQHRIAEILDRAEALRAKRRAALAELDSLTQALFLDMFGDPVGNPKQWRTCNVGEMSDCIVPGRDKPKSFTGNIPWVTTNDLHHLEVTTGSVKRLALSPNEINEVRARVIPKNSVIISCVGDLGIVSLAGADMVINQQLHSFQCHDGLDAVFLMHCIAHQKAFMFAKASSTTLPYMNKTVCNSIPIVTPPFALQQEFALRVTAVEKLKASHRTALADLDALFASLQHRAFRGEL